MKKKTVLLLLLFAMLFSLCSCGAPKTLDEACQKADQLVGKWDRKGTNVSGYEGHYSENSNAYKCVHPFVNVAAVSQDYNFKDLTVTVKINRRGRQADCQKEVHR